MYAYFDKFTIKMTKEQAKAGSHQGECYEDCKELSRVPAIRRQLDNIPVEDIRSELEKYYGAWNEQELSNDNENRIRIIWIAAGEICDDLGL